LPPSADKNYYPAFLDLTGKRCVVVGGGRVAERKCSALIRAGAKVTVISPEITRRLEGYREKGLIKHIRRQYRKGDIGAAFIVVVATGSKDTNKKVAGDALASHKLLNVVDAPSLCNFIVPSVVKRGPLTIAISTGGASPAVARAIRKEIEQLYGPEFSRFLNAMKRVRQMAMREIPDRRERERFLRGLVGKIFTP